MKFHELATVLIDKIEKDIKINQSKIWQYINKMSTMKEVMQLRLDVLSENQLKNDVTEFSIYILSEVERQVERIDLYVKLSGILADTTECIKLNLTLTQENSTILEKALMYFSSIEEYEICMYIQLTMEELTAEQNLPYN